MTSPLSWPALFGVAIQTKTQLLELEPDSHWETLPNVKCSESALTQFETGWGGRLPQDYRDFLLHANGWEAFYFGVGLFGLPELQGERNGPPANELLRAYDDEDVLAGVDLAADDVFPVAAGQQRHLAVVVQRPDRFGQVVWFDDGAERDTFANFKDFFVDMLDLLQDRAERLQHP